MAASSPLTAAAPSHICCPRRRGVNPLWSYNLKETRKYRASSKRYFQRADQKTSLAIIYRTTQFRCKAATMEVALANEILLTGEEAVISAAAAEAVALARAALEVAKEAVQLSETTNFSTSAPQTLAIDFTRSLTDQSFQDQFDESIIHIDEKLTSLVDDIEVTVRSKRQKERRARREIVAEKAEGRSAANKKRDLLKIVKRKSGAYKPLTMAEERELSEGVQDFLKLKAIEKELTERNGQDPSFATWAAAANIDQRMLRQRLEHGMRCKDKMIRCNIRLVVSIAKDYVGAGLAFEHLVQEGCRGLVKGVEKFDGSKGFKFSTYAYWWIKQAIRKSLSRSSRLIQLPFNVVNAAYQVKAAIRELKQDGKTMKDLGTQEIASTAGVTTNMVKKVMMLPKDPRSYESMVGFDKNTKLADIVPCREQDSLEYIVNKEFTRTGIDMVLETLTARENTVIRGRYGLDDGRAKTLQEIGDLMGISRERVRQIELCAFRKLKNKKRMNVIEEYAKAYRT